MEQKGIYVFTTKSYYTAGHAEIYAQGDMTSAMQQASKSQIEELRTYQATTGYDVIIPSKKGLPTTNWRLRSLTDEARATISQRFAFIPRFKSWVFSLTFINRYSAILAEIAFMASLKISNML